MGIPKLNSLKRLIEENLILKATSKKLIFHEYLKGIFDKRSGEEERTKKKLAFFINYKLSYFREFNFLLIKIKVFYIFRVLWVRVLSSSFFGNFWTNSKHELISSDKSGKILMKKSFSISI